ncbi:MAG: flagellar export chaperone FliS [Bilophila sp.]
MLKGTQAYVQTQFTTVGQGDLLILLYDGALKFLARAKDKIEAKDYAAKGVLISKALDVIHELDSSLNMEAGGDLSKNLHQLYFLCSTRLLQANLRMDLERIDSVIGVLTGLRSAYAEILNRPEAVAAGSKIAARRLPNSGTVQKAVPLPTRIAPTGASKAMMHSAYGQQVAPTEATPSEELAPHATPPEAVTPPPPAAPALPEMPSLDMPPVAPVSLVSRRLAATARYGKALQQN